MTNINENWSNLLSTIRQHISEPRSKQLVDLYMSYEERMKTMPASTKMQFHSAFDGGYVYHVLNVIKAATLISSTWISLGVKVNWTEEELIFSALNHDLGKVGMDDQPYYMKNTSEWHVKNQGALYVVNEKLPFMSIHDRSLFLLQRTGIPCTYNETLAIRLHGGLWDDGTKDYLIGYNKPVTALPYILHQADLAASRIEYEQFHLFKPTPEPAPQPEKKRFVKKEVETSLLAANPEADNLKNILKGL